MVFIIIFVVVGHESSVSQLNGTRFIRTHTTVIIIIITIIIVRSTGTLRADPKRRRQCGARIK